MCDNMQQKTRKENAKLFHDLLIKSINQQCQEYKDIGIMLSGGIDSNSILYGLLELKKNVTAYTFYLEGYKSKDLEMAKKICKNLKIKHIPCKIPVENIKTDIINFIKTFHTHRKTFIETKIHYPYLFEKVKQPILMGGEESDMWNGNLRWIILKGANKSHKIFNQIRLEEWDFYRDVDFKINKQQAKKYDFELQSPYYNKELLDFYLQFNWQYLNKPYEKWIILNGFKFYFKLNGYNPQLSFQKGSGMSDYCQNILLKDKSFNFNNRTDIKWVYYDYYKKFS